MRRRSCSYGWVIGAIALVAIALSPHDAAAQSSKAVSALALDRTTISSVTDVKPGDFKPPAGGMGVPGPSPFATLPAFCRTEGMIKPTSDSDIRFEVWMPVAGWNGNFVAVGNGGFAGDINYTSMAEPLSRGYAVASTDTGHVGTALDARWAEGHPEKIVDFGYRGIHEMTVKAKAILVAYYGKPAKRSVLHGVLQRRTSGVDGSAALSR